MTMLYDYIRNYFCQFQNFNQVSLTKILMRYYNYIFPFIIFGRYLLIKFNIYLEAGFFVNF